MISMYSPARSTHANIQFPKKSIEIPSKKVNKPDTTYYDIYQTVDRFDPNMASSPPNPFVNTLKNRMDVYYLQHDNTTLAGLAIENRSRALSIGFT